MNPAVGMAALWAVFVGTHIGLTTRAIRARLVERLGEWGFSLTFSGVAIILFAIVVQYYAAHRGSGPLGLGLADVWAARVGLMAVIVLGIALIGGSFATYFRSPYALHSRRPIDGPYGLERITRHPFLAGVALMGIAHALLARWMVGTVFSLGLATLAVFGSMHQDRKLLARKGAAYAAYLRATSAIPFAAIAAGRQRLVARELPVTALASGVAIAIALRAVHDSIFASGGAWMIGVVTGSVALIALQTRLQARRRRGKRVFSSLSSESGEATLHGRP